MRLARLGAAPTPAPTAGSTGRPGRAGAFLAALALALALAALLAGCGGPRLHPGAAPGETTSPAAGSTTTSVSTTTTLPTTTTTLPTTTTTGVPAHPESSPFLVTRSFLDAWIADDRAAAAAYATPQAVATLFAGRYDGEFLNDRGCSLPGPNPVICAWGPLGGSSPSEPLYDLTVRPAGSNWYVAAVRKLG